MPWFIQHPDPSNVGEPQSVRDAYDAHIQAQAETDAEAEEEPEATA